MRPGDGSHGSLVPPSPRFLVPPASSVESEVATYDFTFQHDAQGFSCTSWVDLTAGVEAVRMAKVGGQILKEEALSWDSRRFACLNLGARSLPSPPEMPVATQSRMQLLSQPPRRKKPHPLAGNPNAHRLQRKSQPQPPLHRMHVRIQRGDQGRGSRDSDAVPRIGLAPEQLGLPRLSELLDELDLDEDRHQLSAAVLEQLEARWAAKKAAEEARARAEAEVRAAAEAAAEAAEEARKAAAEEAEAARQAAAAEEARREQEREALEAAEAKAAFLAFSSAFLTSRAEVTNAEEAEKKSKAAARVAAQAKRAEVAKKKSAEDAKRAEEVAKRTAAEEVKGRKAAEARAQAVAEAERKAKVAARSDMPHQDWYASLMNLGRQAAFDVRGAAKVEAAVREVVEKEERARKAAAREAKRRSSVLKLPPVMRVSSHREDIAIERFNQGLDLSSGKLGLRRDSFENAPKQYDIERAVFCAEMCNHVYLGSSIWASAGSRRAETLRDSREFSFPCRVNLGYYQEANLQGLLGVHILGPEFDGGDVTDGNEASVRHGYLTHENASVQSLLLHDPVESTLYVVFRGTEADANYKDLYTDAKAFPKVYDTIPGARCHAGFVEVWGAIKSRCIETVAKAIDKLDIKRVTVTGHSSGGAIATMCAYCLATEIPKLQNQSPNGLSAAGVSLSVFTFGQAVVGNSEYREAYDAAVPVHWLHQNDKDMFCRLGVGLAFGFKNVSYVHVGTRVFLDEDSCIVGATYEGMKNEEGDGDGGFLELLFDHSMNNYTCLLHLALAMVTIRPEIVDILQAAWNDALEGSGPKVPDDDRPLCWMHKSAKKHADVEMVLPRDMVDGEVKTGGTPNWAKLREGLAAAGVGEEAIDLWPVDWQLVPKMRGRKLGFGALLSSLFRLHFDPEPARRDAHIAAAQVYAWFLHADTNLDGVLSLAECKAAFSELKVHLTETTLADELCKCGVDASGGISFQEFLLWVKSSPAFDDVPAPLATVTKRSTAPHRGAPLKELLRDLTAPTKDRPKFHCYTGSIRPSTTAPLSLKTMAKCPRKPSVSTDLPSAGDEDLSGCESNNWFRDVSRAARIWSTITIRTWIRS